MANTVTVDTSKVVRCTCSPDDGSFTCPREDECFDNWLVGKRVVTFLVTAPSLSKFGAPQSHGDQS